MVLRDYQKECFEAVLVEVGLWDRCFPGVPPPRQPTSGDPVRSTLGNLATSAGKTIIAAKLMEALHNVGLRTIFMADSDELCQQPLDKLRKATGLYAGLEKAGDKAARASKLVVASAQTLAGQKRRDGFIARWGNPDLIIIDEAHRGSPRNKEITDAFPSAKLFGITATAFRSGLADLSDFYQTVCYELHLLRGEKTLESLGYSVPIKVLPLAIEINMDGVKSTAGDFDANAADQRIIPFLEAVAEQVSIHAKNRHIVSFTPLKSSAKLFAEICTTHGIPSAYIAGDSEDRAMLLERFTRREFQHLVNAQLLSTGWDCLPVDCMLNLRPTKSLNFYQQIVGRIIRVLEGVIDGITDPEERKRRIALSAKPDALILDVLFQFKKLGVMGPEALIAGDEEEAAALKKKLRKKTDDPERLAWASEQYRMERNRLLLKAAERAAAEAAKNHSRTAGMMDARTIALQLCNEALIEFKPVSRWEMSAMTPGQKQALERLKINPATVNGKGHASKLIDALKGGDSGIPFAAHAPLRAAGLDPATCSLDDAIRALKDGFPMTMGRHSGNPLRDVPAGWWRWLRDDDGEVAARCRRDLEAHHHAAHRYFKHVFCKEPRQPELSNLPQ